MKINEIITEAVQLVSEATPAQQRAALTKNRAATAAQQPGAQPAPAVTVPSTGTPAAQAAPIIPAAAPSAPKPGVGTGLAKGLIKGLSALSYITDPSGKTAELGRTGIANANAAQTTITKNLRTDQINRSKALGAQQQLTTANINNYMTNWSKQFQSSPNKVPLVSELGAFLADRKGTPEYNSMVPVVKSVLKRSGLTPQEVAQYSATLGIR